MLVCRMYVYKNKHNAADTEKEAKNNGIMYYSLTPTKAQEARPTDALH